MRSGTSKLVAFLAIAWLSGPAPAGAAGDDPDLRGRFLKEYPAAMERLKEAYSHVRGSGIQYRESTNKFGTKKTRHRITFEVDGPNRTMQKEVVVEGDREPGSSRVTTSTPAATFTAEKKKAGATPTLTRLDSGAKPASAAAIDNFLDSCVNAPYIYLKLIPEIFRPPHAGLKSVNWAVKDGRKLVKVEVTRSVEAPYGPKKTFTIYVEETQWLDPDEDWALYEEQQSGRTKEGADNSRTVKIEYGDRVGLARMLIRVSETALSHGKPVASNGFDFDQFSFGPSPALDFTPQAVGLPELSAPASAGRNVWPALFIGGAALFAAGAVFVAVRRRRSS